MDKVTIEKRIKEINEIFIPNKTKIYTIKGIGTFIRFDDDYNLIYADFPNYGVLCYPFHLDWDYQRFFVPPKYYEKIHAEPTEIPAKEEQDARIKPSEAIEPNFVKTYKQYSSNKEDIFDWENTHLQETIINIQDIIDSLDNKIIKNKHSIKELYQSSGALASGSYVQEKEDLILIRNKEIRSLKEILLEPYFARMDFLIEAQKDNFSIYIGEKGVMKDDEQIIVDWRSPIGRSYYKKKDLSYKHNDEDYLITLRRAFEIKNGHLFDYKDEFVYGETIFNEGSMDPFLLNVLSQKKEDQKFTNIIRTIQMNQNEIIEFPRDKSFIVQGCAGSGKTMVLLHRLSYLVFNNINMDLNKVKIITPNENFNIFISDLAEKLELDKIKIYSLEEYYRALLERYGVEHSYQKLNYETDLPREYISEIYSKQFYYSVLESFNSLRNRIFQQIDIENLLDSIKKSMNYKFSKDEFTDRLVDFKKMLGIVKKNQEERISIFTSNLERIRDAMHEDKKELSTKNWVKEIEDYLYFKEKDVNSNYQEIVENLKEDPKEKIETIKGLYHEMIKIYPKILTENEFEKIEKAILIVKSINFDYFYRNAVLLKLHEVQKKYNIPIDFKKTYKYTLYLKLLCASFSYKTSMIFDNYLNIDEGQDLSECEYALFNIINGGNVVFNIYGDMNQSIFSKGIRNWNQIPFPIDQIFTLNENYRNTRQIVDFYNQSLGMDNLPIGLEGEAVIFLDESGIIDTITKLVDTSMEPVAVLIKNYHSNLVKTLSHCGCSIGSLQNRVFVLSVEDAKGLEFKNVLVFTEGMSSNEKYISYTRALKKLMIVGNEKGLD